MYQRRRSQAHRAAEDPRHKDRETSACQKRRVRRDASRHWQRHLIWNLMAARPFREKLATSPQSKGADAFHRTVSGQQDEHANELRDGEAVRDAKSSARSFSPGVSLTYTRLQHPLIVVPRLQGRCSEGAYPQGRGASPQRHRPEGRDARSQGGPHGNACTDEEFIPATDPSPMRAPCTYDIGSLLSFGLYHGITRKRVVFSRWLAPAVASR